MYIKEAFYLNTIQMPASYQELKNISFDKLEQLWEMFFKEGKPLLKPLWYKIGCEQEELKIKQKHITKLNRYARNPEVCIEKSYKSKYLLKPGCEIIKTFKGKEYSVLVETSNKFLYDGKGYKTLSSVAKAICGKKVSGYQFFGLNNKNGGKLL